MKKKKLVLVLGVLLLVLFTGGIVAFTYSRYINNSVGTADAKVATWKVLINDTDVVQNANFSFDGDYITWSDSDYIEDGYIAPSRTGTMKIKLDTTGSKVAVKYTISIDSTVLNEYNQIKITKVNNELATGTYTGIIPLSSVDTPVEIPIEISWLNQEGTNTSDTTIGSTVENLQIPITVTVEQYLGEQYSPGSFNFLKV